MAGSMDKEDLLRDRVRRILMSDAWSMEVLEIVRTMALPDWAIGAGFVRSLVWDSLAALKARTPLPDIDVLFFDAENVARQQEMEIENRLRGVRNDLPWSVRNQARMHSRNGDAPYKDTHDAIGHWLETPTAVGARLETDGSLKILAPLGLEDLFGLKVSPTASGVGRIDQYRSRMKNKRWADKWPGLQVHDLE